MRGQRSEMIDDRGPRRRGLVACDGCDQAQCQVRIGARRKQVEHLQCRGRVGSAKVDQLGRRRDARSIGKFVVLHLGQQGCRGFGGELFELASSRAAGQTHQSAARGSRRLFEELDERFLSGIPQSCGFVYGPAPVEPRQNRIGDGGHGRPQGGQQLGQFFTVASASIMCGDDADPIEQPRIVQLRLIATGGLRQKGSGRSRGSRRAGIHDPHVARRQVLHETIEHAGRSAIGGGRVGQRQQCRQPHLRRFLRIEPRFDQRALRVVRQRQHLDRISPHAGGGMRTRFGNGCDDGGVRFIDRP